MAPGWCCDSKKSHLPHKFIFASHSLTVTLIVYEQIFLCKSYYLTTNNKIKLHFDFCIKGLIYKLKCISHSLIMLDHFFHSSLKNLSCCILSYM